MTIKTIIIAAAMTAISAFGAQASDAITFPNKDVVIEYVAIEIERGFGLDGDAAAKRAGVAQLKAYLDGRRQDALTRGVGPESDDIAIRLERTVAEIEADLAL